jgi:hypothetical protein
MKTMSVTNDGGLTNPPPFTYTVEGTVPFATDFTVSGPSSGVVGSHAGPFTISWFPAGSAVPASLDPLGGVAAVDVWGWGDGTRSGLAYLSPDRPVAELWYLPTVAGASLLHFAMDGWPEKTLDFTVAESPDGAVTFYTLEGDTSGVVGAPAALQVTLGAGTSPGVTITPTDGAGGVFSPASVTLSTTTRSANVAYTPAAPGGRLRISCANTGGLADPPSRPFFARGGPLAAGLTLSGPGAGTVGQTSQAFTTALSAGAIMGATRVYPRSSSRGVFSPSVLDLDNTERLDAFTFTPEEPGDHVISVAARRGLASPAPVLLSVAGTSTEPEPEPEPVPQPGKALPWHCPRPPRRPRMRTR